MNRIFYMLSTILILLIVGCSPDPADHARHDDHSSAGATRTVWTHQLEAFVEVDNQVAGEEAHVLIHLTDLNDFTALDTSFSVEMRFDPEGTGQTVTRQAGWLRPGICEATLSHPNPGTGTLTLQVKGEDEPLRVDLGKIVIGTKTDPGGFLPMPSHKHEADAASQKHAHGETDEHGHDHEHAADESARMHEPAEYDHAHTAHEEDPAEEQTEHGHDAGSETEGHDHGHEAETETGGQRFTKEQQWDMEFKTAPVRSGTLPTGSTVYGRVQARSGYDIMLTAPVDGIVTAGHWPTGGMSTETGQVLFQLTPKVSGEFSLSGLRAAVNGLKAETELTETRLARLEKLLESGTVSRWEVEDSRVRLETLQHRLSAAESDLQTARSMRTRTGEHREQLDIRSPLTGSITHVRVTPGQFVSAGTELIHLVRERPIQLELAVPVQQSDMLTLPLSGLYLKSFTDEEPVYIDQSEMHVLAKTPGVDPETGKISLYLEINRSLNRYPLHAMVEAEVLFQDTVTGIVIPVSSLVDDAGAFVVYRQLSGEQFLRTPVHILHRTGDRILVTGLAAGDRVVTRGGRTLRRAEMVGSGSFQDHGHAH